MLTRSLLTVWLFYEEGMGGGQHYQKKNKEALLRKTTCEAKREDLESLFPLLAQKPLTDLNLQVVPH